MYSETMITAADLKISDIGRKVRSFTYPNKNKTAKPSRRSAARIDGKIVWIAEPHVYEIDSIYAHSNGNILINQSLYLRADTEIEFVE